jgi:hypothetical protein
MRTAFTTHTGIEITMITLQITSPGKIKRYQKRGIDRLFHVGSP